MMEPILRTRNSIGKAQERGTERLFSSFETVDLSWASQNSSSAPGFQSGICMNHIPCFLFMLVLVESVLCATLISCLLVSYRYNYIQGVKLLGAYLYEVAQLKD